MGRIVSVSFFSSSHNDNEEKRKEECTAGCANGSWRERTKYKLKRTYLRNPLTEQEWK